MSNRATRRAAERQSLKLAVKAGQGKVMLAQQAHTAPETALAEQTMTATASVGGSDQPPITPGFAELVEEIKQSSEARLRANRANAQFSTGPRTEEGKAKSSLNAVKTGLTGRTVLLPTDDASEARLRANRANAQFSTGPRTEEGKAKSSLNAVKTGLTAGTVLLPTDDAAIYQQHLDRHFDEFSPANDKEKALVQTIADTEWRLLRIVPLEAGLYAVGRRKLADQFADETDPTNREALIMAEVFTVYLKQLSNLNLQERRLRNQRKADITELQQLQQQRADKQNKALEKRQRQVGHAINMVNQASDNDRDFDLAAHGFDFSFDELYAYGQQNNDETDIDFDQWLAEYRAAQKELKAA